MTSSSSSSSSKIQRHGCPFLFLLRLLINTTVSATSTGLQALHASVEFNPPFVHDLIAGTNRTLQMTVSLDGEAAAHNEHLQRLIKKQPWRIQLKSMDEEVVSVVDSEKELTWDQLNSNNNHSFQTNFTIAGNFLGKTAIRVRLLTADEQSAEDEQSLMQISKMDPNARYGKNAKLLDVWVSQERNRLVNRLFLITLIVLIVIANVLMGCELDMKIVFDTIKKPVAPLIGLCTQFIAMPLLAYGIANVVFVSRGLHSFALGLFVTGCAPGGGASNYWTLLLDGNLPVSVTMTFFSTLAAVVMMPAWMWLFGQHFLRGYDEDAHLKVPYTKIVSSLLTLIIPLFIGIVLARWKPCIRDKARKFMRPFIIFVLVFLVVFGTIANFYMIRLLTWNAVLGGLLLPWCGFTVGCFTSVILRQPPADVTAIAIETGIQNTGIAIMLLKFSFPYPDADISALIPVIAASLTPVPLLTAVGIHSLLKYLKRRRSMNVNNCDVETHDVKEIPVDSSSSGISSSSISLPAEKLANEEGSPLVERIAFLNGERNASVNPSDSLNTPQQKQIL